MHPMESGGGGNVHGQADGRNNAASLFTNEQGVGDDPSLLCIDSQKPLLSVVYNYACFSLSLSFFAFPSSRFSYTFVRCGHPSDSPRCEMLRGHARYFYKQASIQHKSARGGEAPRIRSRSALGPRSLQPSRVPQTNILSRRTIGSRI